MRFSIVVPTVGRSSLEATLAGIAAGEGPWPDEVVVVHDRPADGPLRCTVPERLAGRLRVVEGAGRGPAAARNTGWRCVHSDWVVFLDDDVRPGPHWRARLAADLAAADGDTAAVQGRLSVPLPADRPPTDWERNVAGLADARWITADIAYRHHVLAAVGGFDERFPAAYREDVDLAIRVRRAGFALVRGVRPSVHPVGPADRWVSVRRQRGNADDALLRRLHGRHWRGLGDVPVGRRGRHVAVTVAGLVAVTAAMAGRRRLAAAAGWGWALGTGEFAWRRIAPGPRSRAEVATMLLTSAVIPPVATYHWLRGSLRHRNIDA